MADCPHSLQPWFGNQIRSGAQAKQSEEAAAEKERREEEAENADAASSVSWGWAVMKKIVNGEEIVFTCLVSPDPCIRHFDSKCHTSIKKVFTWSWSCVLSFIDFNFSHSICCHRNFCLADCFCFSCAEVTQGMSKESAAWQAMIHVKEDHVARRSGSSGWSTLLLDLHFCRKSRATATAIFVQQWETLPRRLRELVRRWQQQPEGQDSSYADAAECDALKIWGDLVENSPKLDCVQSVYLPLPRLCLRFGLLSPKDPLLHTSNLCSFWRSLFR